VVGFGGFVALLELEMRAKIRLLAIANKVGLGFEALIMHVGIVEAAILTHVHVGPAVGASVEPSHFDTHLDDHLELVTTFEAIESHDTPLGKHLTPSGVRVNATTGYHFTLTVASGGVQCRMSESLRFAAVNPI